MRSVSLPFRALQLAFHCSRSARLYASPTPHSSPFLPARIPCQPLDQSPARDATRHSHLSSPRHLQRRKRQLSIPI